MSKSGNPSLSMSYSDNESSNFEEDSSFADDGGPKAEDPSESRNAPGKERVDPLYKRVWAKVSKEHDHSDLSTERDFIRKIPTPMFMTTAEQRTRQNMFGETNAVFEQIAIEDPVLYVALYSTGKEPSEVDDYHWVFIVGPSNEEADSKGTQSSMEPFGKVEHVSPEYKEWQWRWLYNQRTIPLRRQPDLLARLMIAEVTDFEMLQAVVLRWAKCVSMRAHPEWMSVKWVKNVLKDLEEERGCLGRRMEGFGRVEAEGKRLADLEEEKRKGFSLLDTRVSTRILFEREEAAIYSTLTVDIAVNYPVLYVGVYAGACSPHEKGDFHWAFLIGPPNDRAESEGVRCGIDFHLDSDDRRTWSYNQTIVPLSRQPGLLVRMLLADIVDLRPVGEILRENDSTPMAERPGSMGEPSEWTSLAWVRDKLEMMERKPECFAYKCSKFSKFEWMGRRAAESLKRIWKEKDMPPFAQFTKLCMMAHWKPPDDDEAKVTFKFDLTRGRPDTISRALQIVTGALGADTLKMRRQFLEKERHTHLLRLKTINRLVKEVVEDPVVKKNEENGDQSEDDEDVDETTETARSAGERGRTNRLELARSTTTVDLLGMNKLTRVYGRISVTEDAKKHRKQSNDKDSSDDEVDVEESDDEDGEDDEQEKGKAKMNISRKRVIGRPDDVRKTATHFLVPNKPDRVIERKKNENQKDEDSSDSEDEDEDEEEEEEEEGEDDSIEDDEEVDDKDDEDKLNNRDISDSEDDGSEKGEDGKSDKEDDEGEDSDDKDENDKDNVRTTRRAEGEKKVDKEDKEDKDVDNDEDDDRDEDEDEDDDGEEDEDDDGEEDEDDSGEEDEDDDEDEDIPKMSLSR